jgi:uncharacterized protein (DUF305 family)
MATLLVRCMTLGLATALAACGSSQPSPHTAPAPRSSGQDDASGIAKAQADSARRPYTQADIDFMSHMIGHHSQAIVMANWAPTHGASPSVQRLAERIINAQQDEISTMQQWLRDRREPLPDTSAAGMTMVMHGGHDQMMMPGMLTQAQLQQLDQARGSEFDRLFLTFMIQHHRGAVSMVQALFGTNGAAQDETVFKFANDVNVDQTTEIRRMELMLSALGPEPHSP